ncbi:MAG: 16S rRNA (cytosine(967)-C(5))-methyltransferase RsmB [Brachymonas sp.]|nr:16S rRNA (cytosine(967)-C(5))-methyltransferase RsmB [Brachymonas sp.]
MPGRKPAAQQAAVHRVVSADGRIALWQQLQYAARLVQAVTQGSSAPTVLDELPSALRAGVQALAYLALRRLGMARWLREQLVPRNPPPAVDALLCTALALAWEPASEAARTDVNARHETASAHGDDDKPQRAGSSAGAAQSDASPYNDFTLVHQAVEAARQHPRMRHQAGLVNACLRAFMREREAWQARCHQAAPQGRAELLNLPAWWWQRLQADYPESAATASAHAAAEAADATGAAFARDGSKESSARSLASAAARPQPQAMSTAAAIALAGQHQPPMHLRVNARCLSPAQYLQEHLLPAGLAGQLHGAYGVVLHKPCPVQQLPGFTRGWVSVQDAAAQLAAPLLLQALQTQPGEKVDAKAGARTGTRLRLLDACAAPGGKTAHLLELGEHEVTALDIDAARCARITENLQRLGLHAQVLVADAGQPAAWWNGQPFDGILLDAPCSASGIVRRHPDIAWVRREADIAQLARTQQHLLHTLWPLLRPGGVLLYATCSVFRAEGQDQIDAFLARHSDAASLPAPGHLLPTNGLAAAGLVHNGPQAVPEKVVPSSLPPFAQPSAQAAGAACPPQWLDHDGFYYALLAKTV